MYVYNNMVYFRFVIRVEFNIVFSIRDSPAADYIRRRDLISCVMYELMRELRHAFLMADSRALIMRRNLTVDLCALRLKLPAQSVNWPRYEMKIGFSSRSCLLRGRGDNATRFNNSELFSSSSFCPFLQGRLIIHARWTQYVSSPGKKSARLSLISGKKRLSSAREMFSSRDTFEAPASVTRASCSSPRCTCMCHKS